MINQKNKLQSTINKIFVGGSTSTSKNVDKQVSAEKVDG